MNRQNRLRGCGWFLLGAIAFTGVLGCSGADTMGIPRISSASPFWAIRLNVEGAVMSTQAPYDTLQLIPTAYDVAGTLVSLPGPVTYVISDTSISVSPTGLVTAKHVNGQAFVAVSVQDTSLNVTNVDTAYISITATVPTASIGTFSIQPTTGDSAILDLGNGTKVLTPRATTTAGQSIPVSSLAVRYKSSDVSTATVSGRTTGTISAVNIGTILLTATTTFYGVTKVDSISFRIGYPDLNVVTYTASQNLDGTYHFVYAPGDLTVQAGKTVAFEIADFKGQWIYTQQKIPAPILSANIDVVFDDSSAADSSRMPMANLAASFLSNNAGNLSISVPDSLWTISLTVSKAATIYRGLQAYCQASPYPCGTARSFSTPGSYHFHSAITGATGIITVVP